MPDEYPESVNVDLMRSPDLLDAARSRLLVVDLQQKLVPAIPAADRITQSVSFLLKVAELAGVPVCISEQYPHGLGPTIDDVISNAASAQRFEKLRFSAADKFCELTNATAGMARDSPDCRDQIVVAGVETHVCVLQTALDLVGRGFRVCVVADAVGSRHAIDHDTALDRMRDSSVTICTAETVAFEWCEVAGTETFRAVSRLVRARDADR